MSYRIQFRDGDGSGDSDSFELCTTHGLMLLSAWADSLPTGTASAFRRFLDHGHTLGTGALAAELSESLRLHPPDDPDVEHTARGLLDLIGVGDAAETATITGVGEDEDDSLSGNTKSEDAPEAKSAPLATAPGAPPDPDLAEARALLRLAMRTAGVPLHPLPFTDAERSAIFEALIAHAEDRMRDAATHLVAAITPESKGLVSDAAARVAAWKAAAGQFLRRVFLAGTLALTDPMTPSDAARFAAANQQQQEYLDGFARAILNGDQAPEGIPGRAARYAGATWSVAEGVARNHAINGGITQERRVVESQKPCDVCIDEASKGWSEPGSLREIGDSPCGVNCRCIFEYR